MSWSGEPSGNYTRNITSISGGLAAIQHNGEAPILQVANLHGDIIATASDSETATKLAGTVAEPTEFGVPATEAPAKYSWLGAHELPTQLPSGIIAMGARSYIPQLGRFLQTDPIPGGSANAYAYTYGDPINQTDLTGELTWGWTEAGMKESETTSQQTIAENAAREEAERKAADAAAQAQAYEEPEGPEEEEEEEEGEEEGEYVAWLGNGTQHEQSLNGAVFLTGGSGQLRQSSEAGSALTDQPPGFSATPMLQLIAECETTVQAKKRGGKGEVPTGKKRPPRRPGIKKKGKQKPEPRRPPGGKNPKGGYNPNQQNNSCEPGSANYNLCV